MLFNTTDINNDTKEITITFVVPEKDFIYKDFITCSVDKPEVTLSPWKANKQSIGHYDPTFKETKDIYNETFFVFMTATTTKWIDEPIHLYCSYYRKSEKKINHTLFTFAFGQPIQPQTYDSIEDTATPDAHVVHHHPSIIDIYTTKITIILQSTIDHFHHYSRLYFFILIFFVLLFFAISHYGKKQLQKYQTINELFKLVTSFLFIIVATCMHVYLACASSAQTSFTLGWLCASYSGFLYIKKSTNLKTGFLRAFCTFFGTLLIAGAFILLFKAVQF